MDFLSHGGPIMERREIGNYVLEAPLGKGGMGEVFLARHKSLGTRAAVKALAVHVGDDPDLRERFSREAKAQARLSHPNIARVLDHVEQDGQWHLIVEYLDGGTLKDAIEGAGGPMPIARAVTWARQALAGLDYGHQKGIIHRDVKPANILINERGEAAVADFGLARLIGEQRLTRTGTALGTPQYMSPEQIDGSADLDHRTDVYSLGVVLYEMLAGRLPIQVDTPSEVVRVLVQDPKPLPELRPDVPPELARVVMKALAKNPEDRFASCNQFAEALRPFESFETGPVAAAVADTVVPTVPVPESAPPPAAAPPPPAAPAPPETPAPSGEEPPPQTSSSGKSSRWPLVAAVLAVLLLGAGVLAAGAWFAYDRFFANVADVGEGTDGGDVAELDGESPPAGGGGRVAGDPGGEYRPLGDGGEGTSNKLVASTGRDGSTVAEDPSIDANSLGTSSSPTSGDPPPKPVTEPRTVQRPGDRTARTPPSGSTSGDRVAGDRVAGDRVAGDRVAGDRVADVEQPPPTRPPPSGPAPAKRTERKPEPPPPPVRPAPPPLPPTPKVAVLALGEPAFAGHLEEQLEASLRGADLVVEDERNVLALNDALRRYGDNVSLGDLVSYLRDADFHVLVLAQTEITGERELQYLGRVSYATQARVRLNAYLLADQKPLGRGWSEDVEYTDLNAEDKAGGLFSTASGDLARAVLDGWNAYRDREGR